jgi:hypothetical protein
LFKGDKGSSRPGQNAAVAALSRLRKKFSENHF